jgi:hypothetical protein
MATRSALPSCVASLAIAALSSSLAHGQPYPFSRPAACGNRDSVTEEATRELAAQVSAAQRIMDAKRVGVLGALRDFADHACAAGDRVALDTVYLRCFRECVDSGELHAAHLDYAGVLERFGDLANAELSYQQALALRPEPDEIAAYNTYALFLDRNARPRDALDLLNRIPDETLRLHFSTFSLKLWVMKELGLDTGAADAELRRATTGLIGMRVGSPAPGAPPSAAPPPLVSQQDAISLARSLAGQSEPIASIEVLMDVFIEPAMGGLTSERGHLYYYRVASRVPSETPPRARVPAGQRLAMLAYLGSGRCRIAFEGRVFDVSSCPWLPGSTDRDDDIFRIVAEEPPSAVAAVRPSDEPKLLGGTFAEGYSSATPDEPIDLAHRMFTTSDAPCAKLEATPTRLESSPDRIVVRIGETFSLPTIVLRALDGSGRLIPRVPIDAVISYERGALRFESDQRTQFSITGEHEGRSAVILESFCGNDLRITVPIEVVP